MSDKTMQDVARTVKLSKRRPCFHCCKSLHDGISKWPYTAYALDVNGYEQYFHKMCVNDFQLGNPRIADTEDFECEMTDTQLASERGYDGDV